LHHAGALVRAQTRVQLCEARTGGRPGQTLTGREETSPGSTTTTTRCESTASHRGGDGE
jgi:hypothetical protein